MGLYKVTVIRKVALVNQQVIENGMEVSFSSFIPPWSDNNGKPINDAFMRVYGIDLKAHNVLSPGFLEVTEIK
ncbi:DUF6140 family protein [Flavobacterium sp. JP2137]|uniref:DUF6140 family protein n=1 Tax=Flavobacterium sp. JP2137 TaxID=3414510 RepID=UPI003D2FA57D